MSGLNINFAKSALISFDYEDSWVKDVSYELRCMVVELPIVYLGIPFGANARKESELEANFGENREKISSVEKARLPSRAGRGTS